jgi:Bacterial Ig domain
VLFDIAAGQDILLFSFKNSNTCSGPIGLWTETDPFQVPNTANFNVGNQISILGAGIGNKWHSNYGSSPVVCNPLPAPNVSMTSTGPTTGTVNTPLTFSTTLTNNGTAPTSGVLTVTTPLASGMTYTSSTGVGWTCGVVSSNVVCTNPNPLAANGGTSSLGLTFMPTSTGNFNVAPTTSGGGLPAPVSATPVSVVVSAVPISGCLSDCGTKVRYRIALGADGQTYTVYMKSAASYTGSLARISTAQVTVVVPHQTASNRFVVSDLIGFNSMIWSNASRVDAPSENPSADYISFGFNQSASPALFTITAEAEIPLFSFRNAGPCTGNVKLWGSSDPLQVPNSASVNPGNQITILGNGVSNAWNCNYGCEATCPPVVVQRPQANVDILVTTKNRTTSGNVLHNDVSNGRPLTVNPLVGALNGSLSFGSNGSYTYIPNTGYVGRDSAQYEICDNQTTPQCASAWIYVQVVDTLTTANRPPVALPDYWQTFTGLSVSSQVTSNDFDPEGSPLVAMLLRTTSSGSLTLQSNGSFTYTPNAGFTGLDTFVYRVCDAASPTLCSSATASIRVTSDVSPANDAPLAQSDAFSTPKNVILSGNVSLNDQDLNPNTTLVYNVVSPAQNGSVILNANGTFAYVPNTNFVGSDQFSYQVCDNSSPAFCATATVYLSVLPVSAPVGCFTANLKVLLEGPYQTSSGLMTTVLNQRGLLPGQSPVGMFAVPTPAGQPYSGLPWNFVSSQSVASYASTVTDWVLVSLRSSEALASKVHQWPALLHRDGTVTLVASCPSVPNGQYFVVVEHRNHTGVMSMSKQTVTGNQLSFDFTTADSYITTNPPSYGQKLLSNGKFAMMSGDGKKDTFVNNFDINFNDSLLWKLLSGIFDQYQMGDFNLDADVNFADNVLWKNNNGKYSAVPH